MKTAIIHLVLSIFILAAACVIPLSISPPSEMIEINGQLVEGFPPGFPYHNLARYGFWLPILTAVILCVISYIRIKHPYNVEKRLLYPQVTSGIVAAFLIMRLPFWGTIPEYVAVLGDTKGMLLVNLTFPAWYSMLIFAGSLSGIAVAVWGIVQLVSMSKKQ